MNNCYYCGRPISMRDDGDGLQEASDEPGIHQACAEGIDGTHDSVYGLSTPEGLFSYTGTVAGLALTLENNRRSLAYELSREAHLLESLMQEQWPVAAWQLIPSR